MTRVLPPHPSLDHLKNEAKSLLKAQTSGDVSVCKTFRLLHRFKGASDQDILSSEVSLHEAQFALAMDYGFSSWDDLRKHVVAITTPPESEFQARPGALLLENPPAGGGRGHWIIRGIAMLLSREGVEADYHTLMGDSGAAFILQADAKATPWGKPVKQIDIGWWPLDSWGTLMRLGFLGDTIGQQLVLTKHEDEEFLADPKAYFKKYLAREVEDSLRGGRICLAMLDMWWAITGLDDGEPPLLGVRTVFDGPELRRLPGYPCTLMTTGERAVKLDRRQADVRALEYAVALIRDDVSLLSAVLVGCPLQSVRDGSGKTTGQKSFALWARLLRDPEGWGAHMYHANVVLHMKLNRSSAPVYLRQMAERHGGQGAVHLHAAAASYDEILAELKSADTSKDSLHSSEGREKLARLVEELAKLEAGAAERMTEALAAVR